MPTEVTGFRCDTCCAIHAHQKDAEFCEKRHAKPEVVRFEWLKGKFLPEAVVIRYERDGTVHEQSYY